MLIVSFGNIEMQSFQLDRKSGKKCYMLSARYLAIAWGDDRYCNWIVVPDSRLALNFSICFILIVFINLMISNNQPIYHYQFN